MNRRKLLTFIGLAPFVPVAAKAAEPARAVPFVDGHFAQYDRLVCENHHDKAWPEECSCGPGMRYGDTLRS